MVVGLLGMINGRERGDRYGVSIATANATVAAVVADWDWGTAADGANVWGWVSGCVHVHYSIVSLRQLSCVVWEWVRGGEL